MPSFILSLVSLTFFYIAILVSGPPPQAKRVEHRVYYAPPIYFKFFHFGHSESLADGIWIRLIQDIDLCADSFTNDHVPSNILKEKEINPRACSKGWTFRMFDIITDLAPRFRIAHAVGGLTLSVLLDDYDAAALIFDKGINNFPNDWPILYRAGYFYSVERKDFEKAAALFTRAAKAGAPDWVNLSAARLYSESGRKEIALRVLQDYHSSLEDEASRKVVEEKIAKILRENQ